MTVTRWTRVETSIGTLTLVAGPQGVEAVHFPERAPALPADGHDPAGLAEEATRLRGLVEGGRRAFGLPIHLEGTRMQREVWAALREIPYGETISYSQLAERVGRPEILRAVAATVGATPIPIIVPCHRVIAADGSLRGYGGGLERKAALLATERRVSGQDPAGRPGQLVMV